MPIFEYICRECENHFEALVQGAMQPECPSCRSRELEKQLSVFAAGTKRSNSLRDFSAPGACGMCGDPRGPGACSNN